MENYDPIITSPSWENPSNSKSFLLVSLSSVFGLLTQTGTNGSSIPLSEKIAIFFTNFLHPINDCPANASQIHLLIFYLLNPVAKAAQNCHKTENYTSCWNTTLCTIVANVIPNFLFGKQTRTRPCVCTIKQARI